MKSLRWIIPLFVVMAGAFAIYLWTQPVSPIIARKGPTSLPTALLTTTPTTALADGQSFGSGEDPNTKTYDQKTGRLASQFRAERYDPQPDNSVSVTAPVAEFFQDDGQMLRIRGSHGRVVLSGEAGQPNSLSTKNGPPSRGDLFDVIIELFHSTDAPQPFLRCDVPNVRFDNDTFSIATEAYRDATGNEIPADRVPVEVTGDYEFKGQGLLIRWNERDRRLQLLEIAHGDTLTIRDPSKIGQKPKPATRPGKAEIDPFADIALADADAESTKEAVRSAAPKKVAKPPAPAAPVIVRDRSPVSYRATFFEDVHVFQGGQQIADADVMHVDFTEAVNDDDAAATQPAAPAQNTPSTRSATRRAATRPATRPATRAVTRPSPEAPTHATTPAPATTTRAAAHSPTTFPAEPITIKWSGKLHVTPPPADVTPVPPGEMAVEMSKANDAVTLMHDGSTIRCGSFRYRSGDDSLAVNRSAAVPVVAVTDADGAMLMTDGIVYDGKLKQARLSGAGKADVPLASLKPVASTEPATAPAGRMIASWSKGCTLDLTGETRETLSFDRAILEGDVNVDHPQLKLAAGKLDLAFAPDPAAATRRSDSSKDRSGVVLKKLDASDNVRCSAAGADGKMQNIASQHLTLDTAKDEQGHVVPRKMLAEGTVRANDGENNLQAGRLEATLTAAKTPTTKSTTAPSAEDAFAAVEVESVDAQQDVIFNGADGTHATAESLHIQMKDGKPQIELQGQLATIGNKTDTVAGPIVKIDPAAGTAQVVRGGTLTSYRSNLSPATEPSTNPTTAPATTRPVVVTWEDGLKVDGPANRVDVDGNVTIASSQDDGTNNLASGQRLFITLRDKPTTQPATQPVTQPATKKSDATGLAGIDASSFGNKEIDSVTLEEGVEIKSVLNGPDGVLLRRMHMIAPLVRYEADAKRMIVPAPGRLLFQDEQRATTRPSATPPAKDAGQVAGLGDFKGVTAFEWKKQLSYDEAARRIKMEGNVVIVHQDDVSSTGQLRIEAGEVLADLEPQDSTNKPANPDAAGPLGSSAKLKSLEAVGGVRLNSPQLNFEGDSIHFDPATDTLVAVGSDAHPVTLYDDRGASKGTFSELRYNTRTQQMNLKGVRAGIRR